MQSLWGAVSSPQSGLPSPCFLDCDIRGLRFQDLIFVMTTNDVLALGFDTVIQHIDSGFEPLYFLFGILAGLLFMNLFKGRWIV